MNSRTPTIHNRLEDCGFSLIEVLVVIAIILVVAAMAIPNLLRSKMAANEASAVASLHVISTVEISYETTYGTGFAAALSALGIPPTGTPVSATQAGLIDEPLASGIRGGYSFVYTAQDTNGDGKIDTYTVNANPVSPGQTGQRFFFVDQTNVIRQAPNDPAGPASEPIPQ